MIPLEHRVGNTGVDQPSEHIAPPAKLLSDTADEAGDCADNHLREQKSQKYNDRRSLYVRIGCDELYQSRNPSSSVRNQANDYRKQQYKGKGQSLPCTPSSDPQGNIRYAFTQQQTGENGGQAGRPHQEQDKNRILHSQHIAKYGKRDEHGEENEKSFPGKMNTLLLPFRPSDGCAAKVCFHDCSPFFKVCITI
ncbi:hypothetical protein [Paenibacillus chitinolyticus]